MIFLHMADSNLYQDIEPNCRLGQYVNYISIQIEVHPDSVVVGERESRED